MDEKRLEQQIAFCREIDKEKFIGRQTWLTGATRKENDAEHAWHMAVMTVLLSEYANEEIDVLRTMTMLLIHDLVEIYAGDTYAYDEEGKKTQKRRELVAADRLFQMLPEDQGKKFREIWEEFEAENTPESRFARTMDNLQPMMLNAATDGRQRNPSQPDPWPQQKHSQRFRSIMGICQRKLPAAESGKGTDRGRCPFKRTE